MRNAGTTWEWQVKRRLARYPTVCPSSSILQPNGDLLTKTKLLPAVSLFPECLRIATPRSTGLMPLACKPAS
jgi:hypothetical protein